MTFDRWPQPETLRAAPDYTIGQLQAAMAEGQILTGQAVHCDTALNLHIRLGALSGIMPRGECVAPFLSGAQREIAVLSCVGRGVCCRVTGQRTAPNGDTELLLSRRLAQEEAMDYIGKSCKDPGLSVGQVAAGLGLSEGHLSHLFKKETGLTVGSYLTRCRMQKAMALLKEGKLRVYEVAEAVGYKDITYFSGTFKKLTGMSPTEYQNASF